MKLSLVTTALLAAPASSLVARSPAQAPRVQLSADADVQIGEVAVPYSNHANSEITELKAEAWYAETRASRKNAEPPADVETAPVQWSSRWNAECTELKAEAWYEALKENKKSAALKSHTGFMANLFGSAAAADATESLGLGARATPVATSTPSKVHAD